METKEILKAVIGFVTSASVGTVMKNVVNHNQPWSQSPADRLLSTIGGIIITTVVSDHCAAYVEKQIFKEEEKK